MMFSLDVRRARKGDCLLLHFGAKGDPGLVLIDGGPKGVYTPHLKPRLEGLRQARGLARDEALPVDLVMVSHVDDDHIQGLLDLTKEMVEARNAHRPLSLRVLSFWHNSFDAIIGNTPAELLAGMSGKFGAASLEGGLPADATLAEDENWPAGRPEEEVIVDSLKVLASIAQGHRLRDDARRLEFPSNPEFDGSLIMATERGQSIDVGQGLTFTVVGPMKPELEALHAQHEAWLKSLGDQGKSPADALAAYVDRSVPNLSSIVVLAEAEGKRMLLTGDARGDKVLKGLQHVGLLGPGEQSTMHVDLLKVPHHGSAANVEWRFFERITADHYVFSGNGEHGNPERETLEMLFAARGAAPFVLHFTYPIDEIDAERKKDWAKEQDKERKRKAKNPDVKVRANWSPKKHSVAACLAATPRADGQQIEVIVADTRPHVIDLLDRVDF
jgi:hypothetical protein